MRTDEKDLQDKITLYLSRYFEIEKEVWSEDRKSRIDIVMIHKIDITKQYPIGIEIKTDSKKTGSSLGAWLQQAITYTLKSFIKYGKLMIITYPQISSKCMDEGSLMSKHDVNGYDTLAHQHNVNTFLGHFNLGELQKYRRGTHQFCRVVFNGKLIWDEYKDQFRTNNYLFSCKQ
jgi:hypothetical protein